MEAIDIRTTTIERDQLADSRPHLIFRVAGDRLFGALVVKAEDVAETAALGASMEFANLVTEDLKSHAASRADG